MYGSNQFHVFVLSVNDMGIRCSQYETCEEWEEGVFEDMPECNTLTIIEPKRKKRKLNEASDKIMKCRYCSKTHERKACLHEHEKERCKQRPQRDVIELSSGSEDDDIVRERNLPALSERKLYLHCLTAI